MVKNWRSPHDSQPRNTALKRNALAGAIVLSLAAFILQLVGSFYSGSLALLGDTAHVLTDLLSLVMSLIAVVLAARPAHKERSFGFFRLEVLASFLNGFLLLIVAIGLVKEGVERFFTPEPVKILPMIEVATIGLLFNVLAAWILLRASVGHSHGHEHAHNHGCGHDHGHDHSHASVKVPTKKHKHEEIHSDRNLRSAILHMWSDALNSVAVIVGGVVMHFTGWVWVDAVVGVIIALWILRWAWHVIVDSGHVLLESTPRHVNAEQVVASLKLLDQRVSAVDDLHVWELTSMMYAATAEVRVKNMDLVEAEAIRNKMHELLKREFGIAHVVLAIRPS